MANERRGDGDRLADEGREIERLLSVEGALLTIHQIIDWTERAKTHLLAAGVELPELAPLFAVVGWEDRAREQVRTLTELVETAPQSAGRTGRAFVSYVSEDGDAVRALAAELQSLGARLWLDRAELSSTPGVNWKEAIRDAIRGGNYFIACFSAAWLERDRTHANEELNIAIEELRLRSAMRPWFIPVSLTPGAVPDLPIDASRRLGDLQWVDLAADWEAGVMSIAELLAPLPTRVRVHIDLLHSSVRRDRATAAQWFYSEPDPRALYPLMRAIGSADVGDREVVYWSARALGKLRDPRAIPVLIDALIAGVGDGYKLLEVLELFDDPRALEFVSAYRAHMEDGAFELLDWLATQRPSEPD